jgi:acyl carrier protein
MDNTEARLIDAFRAVFPALSDNEIREATLTSLESWDSIASITLLAVLEEEFGISVSPADLPQLVSFTSILVYLRGAQSLSS